jgi:hypothetical protein
MDECFILRILAARAVPAADGFRFSGAKLQKMHQYLKMNGNIA